MITGLHHINLVVPPATLPAAHAFYGTTLGLTPRPVPARQRDTLAWFDLGASGQQVHIALGPPAAASASSLSSSSHHPCFRVADPAALDALRARVWAHYEQGGAGAPMACDRPGDESSGAQGPEYPRRFFARDFAGNRLEFSYVP